MPRPKPKGPTVHFQLKLYGEDAERWQKLWDIAHARNPYIDATKFNRLLMGLDVDLSVVTIKDRVYFQGQLPQTEMLGRSKSSKPHIKEVPVGKRK